MFLGVQVPELGFSKGCSKGKGSEQPEQSSDSHQGPVHSGLSLLPLLHLSKHDPRHITKNKPDSHEYA